MDIEQVKDFIAYAVVGCIVVGLLSLFIIGILNVLNVVTVLIAIGISVLVVWAFYRIS